MGSEIKQPYDGIIKLAVMAVGGQGGGVLTGWIEGMARAQGYAVQATSVAGVAQRTGATIYYVEMAQADEATPIFALAPAAGDVDILIAAEMMEVGRAVQRGFISPDRTVLIGSTHRSLAVSEKTVPGDGIADSAAVRAAAEVAARRQVLADFEALAVGAGSVISASLFGALAGSGALPFERTAFEDAICSSGKGVEASLRAFAAGFDAAHQGKAQTAPASLPQNAAPQPTGPTRELRAWEALFARVAALPDPVQPLAVAGLRKVVTFQDALYGAEYLEKVERFLSIDTTAGHELTAQAAKYIANAMAYDDVIKVADEKTRAARFVRIRVEMRAGEVMQLTDFTHPRGEEIVSLFPAWLGRWVKARPRLLRWVDRRVSKGRRLRTDRVGPYLQLWLIAGLRRWRRGSLRHSEEMVIINSWLGHALHHAVRNPALSIEILRARRLIKGYSDTLARCQSKYGLVMSGISLVASRDDAAEWARRLITASLQDETGSALEGAIATIKSI